MVHDIDRNTKDSFLSQGYMMLVNCVLISYINKVSETFLTCEQNHKLKKSYVFEQRKLTNMLRHLHSLIRRAFVACRKKAKNFSYENPLIPKTPVRS